MESTTAPGAGGPPGPAPAHALLRRAAAPRAAPPSYGALRAPAASAAPSAPRPTAASSWCWTPPARWQGPTARATPGSRPPVRPSAPSRTRCPTATRRGCASTAPAGPRLRRHLAGPARHRARPGAVEARGGRGQPPGATPRPRSPSNGRRRPPGRRPARHPADLRRRVQLRDAEALRGRRATRPATGRGRCGSTRSASRSRAPRRTSWSASPGGPRRVLRRPDAASLGKAARAGLPTQRRGLPDGGRPGRGGASPGKAAADRPGPVPRQHRPRRDPLVRPTLDAAATADLSATAVPQPGVPPSTTATASNCGSAAPATSPTPATRSSAHFGQDEGAMTLTSAVSRIAGPGPRRDRATRPGATCCPSTAPGRGLRPGRWPLELRFDHEAPLPPGTVPAAARTDYGPAPAPLTGTPEDVAGGTGFNDATALTRASGGTGCCRGRPATTRCTSDGASSSPTRRSSPTSRCSTAGGHRVDLRRPPAYAPGRLPVRDASDAHDNRMYDGSPVSVGLGTVPVTWTNRWVDGSAASAVHRAGRLLDRGGPRPGRRPAGPRTPRSA